MTTIAYKDGIIAYDSRSTCGYTITNDSHEKCHIVDGARFFYCGGLGDRAALIESYKAGEYKGDRSGSALVVDDKLYYIGMNKEDGFWKQELELDNPRAIGSGEDHAFTAMDMGATAKEAVKWAMKRDTGTGGRIRTYRLKDH